MMSVKTFQGQNKMVVGAEKHFWKSVKAHLHVRHSSPISHLEFNNWREVSDD
jgi:hypothetical protein